MFTGNENHDIDLDDAAKLTKNYRDTFSSRTDITFIKAEYFGKSAVTNMLAQDGCVGMRIYYGLDEEDVPKLVLVGVDSSGNDMVEGTILEMGHLCPPSCSTNNALNSDISVTSA